MSDETKTAHTPGPFDVDLRAGIVGKSNIVQFTGERLRPIAYAGLPGFQMRLIECWNALRGLNPAGVKPIVSMLEGHLERAEETGGFVNLSLDDVRAALAKLREEKE